MHYQTDQTNNEQGPHHGYGRLPTVENLPSTLSVKQVAEFLGISRAHVYRLYHRGLLPGGFRMGRRIIFLTSAVVECIRMGGSPLPPNRNR